MSEIDRAIEFFEGQIAEVKEAMKPPVLVPVEHLEKCRVSYSLAIEALKEKQQREDVWERGAQVGGGGE